MSNSGPAVPAGPMTYNQVVLLGDSLFQQSTQILDGFCFQGALQDHCIRRLDVVNRGFSGWNTRNVLRYLDKIIPPRSASTPTIEYLLVLLGANDACLELDTTSQHVDEEEYRSNLKKIITHPNVTAHKPKILLVTPPPIDELRNDECDKPAHGRTCREAAVSARYSEIARQVAADVAGTTLIDLQKVLMDEAVSMTPGLDSNGRDENGRPLGYPGGKRGALEQLLPDGLHLSGHAYRVFFETVQPHIGPFPPEGSDADAGYVFPAWKTANPTNHKGERIYDNTQ